MLPDIQNSESNNKIPINKVGIKDLKYPVKVFDKTNKYQHTIADVSMYVDLPAHYKGTHMSRFVEILSEHDKEVSVSEIKPILKEIKNKLNAQKAHLEIRFPYFVEKKAPVSNQKALLDYNCEIKGNLGDELDYIVKVEIPIHTLCPCSKEISKYSAHNQRSYVTITYKSQHVVWIEDIIKIAENSASTQIYPLLKRVDEKYVTEEAYENPRFVEDIVRIIACKLEDISEIDYYKVESQNMESIHNHNAYACIEKK